MITHDDSFLRTVNVQLSTDVPFDPARRSTPRPALPIPSTTNSRIIYIRI
jgi:hypothetical protein